jgi:hypothetical protein
VKPPASAGCGDREGQQEPYRTRAMAMSVTILTEPSSARTDNVHSWQRGAAWRTHGARSPARAGAGHRPQGARMSAWLRRACRRGAAEVRGAAPARDGAADRSVCARHRLALQLRQGRDVLVAEASVSQRAIAPSLPNIVHPRGWRGAGMPVLRASHGSKGSKGLQTNRFFVCGKCS